jgi:hypothetical protein
MTGQTVSAGTKFFISWGARFYHFREPRCVQSRNLQGGEEAGARRFSLELNNWSIKSSSIRLFRVNRYDMNRSAHTLDSVSGRCCCQLRVSAEHGSLSEQGERVRSSNRCYKIAAGEPSIPETFGNVSGAGAGRRTGERPSVENDREKEHDLTTYPLEFHRRSEQKWALRAQASSARESPPRATRIGHSQRGQRGSDPSQHPGQKPMVAGNRGNGYGSGTMGSTTPSRNISLRS